MTDLDYELTDFIAALMVYDRVAFFNSRFAVDCVTAMMRKYGHDEFTKVSSELYKHHLRERNVWNWEADRFVPYERGTA
jgi:hypothetical protein